MLALYNIAIQLYGLIIRLFSLSNTKAALFIKGRRNIFLKIAKQIDPANHHIWFHFASLGEFEQGRTVLEKIKEQHPEKKIVITFFSPSGYEIKKNYSLAAGIFYLPLDTASNAKKLMRAFNPEMAIFTKYEYWYHYFNILQKNNIPLFIISGIFRPDQIFFRWYGSFPRKILACVNHFFVQNKESIQLLKTINIHNSSLSGDTRFDRVAENASSPKKLSLIEEFCGNAPVFIAGSTWPEDERLIAQLSIQHPEWKFIIAPHEVENNHINETEKLFPGATKYSSLNFSVNRTPINTQTLIINNIGMLSSLYLYAKVAYIGGGFGAGIHNILEAAAFGIPVIFGPKYNKFQEAKDLIVLGAAISISDQTTLSNAFEKLVRDKTPGEIARGYVTAKTGSTDQILQHIAAYIKI